MARVRPTSTASPGPAAGRVRLRRLPAGRRDRPVQPGDAGGRRLRRRAAGSVLGICNGFQVLAEAGPRARRPAAQPRACASCAARSRSRPERLDTPFTRALGGRRPLRMPVAHGEGCYFADDATLDALERDGQVPVPLRRTPTARPAGPTTPGNPNGSLRGDRRRPQRRRQRRGPDAPPGDGRRGGPRLGRRAGDHPLVRRERGRAGDDRVDRGRRSARPRRDGRRA